MVQQTGNLCQTAIREGNKAIDRLEQGMLKLETFPEKFRAYEKEPWHGRGLRVMPVDNGEEGINLEIPYNLTDSFCYPFHIVWEKY